jgi:signal transduction histidine kinase
MVGAVPQPATNGPDERTGWLLVRDDGVIVAANEPAAALLGARSTEGLNGRTWASLVWIGDGASLAAAYEAFERGAEWRGVLHFQFDQESLPLAVTITSRTPGRDEVTVIGIAATGPSDTGGTPAESAVTRDLEVLVDAIEASAELQDVHSISRAVLQAIRAAIPFEWGVVLKTYPGTATVTPSGAEVVASYPTGLAGIDRGTAWAPLDAAEQELLTSGEPSLDGQLDQNEAGRSPFRRLPAFGMRSRLLVPLFAPGGAGVAGCVAVYRTQPVSFSADDGLRLERFVRRLGRHIGSLGADDGLPVDGPTSEPAPPLPPPPVPPSTPADETDETIEELLEPGAADEQASQPSIDDPGDSLQRLADFAAGVAHELNNPLAAVLGYAQLLPQLGEDERAMALNAIEQETLRASQVARDLLAFARQQPAQRRDVRVDAVVRRVLGVMRHELAESDIELVANFSARAVIEADEPQLEQALLNLLRNARDAMSDSGGTLTVTTSSDTTTVRIEVADTGPGVAADIAARMFEPFVSSREDRTHQGMGLAIVHGIAGGHGGRVWHEPVSPRGARLILELPIKAVS